MDAPAHSNRLINVITVEHRGTIELHLRNIGQLFDTLDPSFQPNLRASL
jgi:hypothetical protein